MTTSFFPANPVEDQVYLKEDTKVAFIFKNNAWRRNGGEFSPVALKLNSYDLLTLASTGPMDLSAAQVFKVDNTATGTINVDFQNIPAERAMTVVVEVTGNVGTLVFPGSVTFATGAPELKEGVNNLVFFKNGSNFTGYLAPKA